MPPPEPNTLKEQLRNIIEEARMVLDMFVVVYLVSTSAAISTAACVLTLALLLTLWFVLPLITLKKPLIK
jgi:hypothetical protein